MPSTVVVAKSPIVTPICSAPGLACSCATIASERSIPCTRTTAPGERRRDPAGADAELERCALAGQVGEEGDDGVDDGRDGLVGVPLVEPFRYTLAEVVLQAWAHYRF